MHKKPRIAVVGAGAFGGWTALYLLRRGAHVVLLDAWGPGNSRASSGGETRVLRCIYGANQLYSKMAARAAQLWRVHEKLWRCELLHRIGVLWMTTGGNNQFELESLPILREMGVSYDELSAADIAKRWPQMNSQAVDCGIYEPHGGYLLARLACEAVVEGFRVEGGEYRQIAVAPPECEQKVMSGLTLADGSTLAADQYVFACGPWMGKLFPESIGDKIRPTKQDVFFFGTPAGEDRFPDQKLPVWLDHRETFIYGIPGNQDRGFKIADDARGPEFDPTSGERVVSQEGLKKVREYLGFRFPALKDAPLVETQVCQYEDTPDGNFIIDRHPAATNVWLVCGGSGHGFKHGPAVGEMVAGSVMRDGEVEPMFRLARFNA